jgi:hypothetical protein
MLAVVVADVEVEGEYQFERRRYGSNPDQLRLLSEWLIEQQVEEVVMESTAQYWQPVWGALERYWQATSRKREGAGPMTVREAARSARVQPSPGPRRARESPSVALRPLCARAQCPIPFPAKPGSHRSRLIPQRRNVTTADSIRGAF